MAPELSVVIPTRDRRATLLEALEAVALQDVGGRGVEVVVVDDGSADGTADAVAARPGDDGLDVRLLRQPPSGPAAARNRGIEAARAGRVLLLGDDTVPAPGTLARHLDEPGAADGALQGRIEWDPALEVTRTMAFLAPEGPQFYFKGLEDGRPIPYTAVLGSNLSAPRRWFLDDPFDEAFTDACFEDTELAYRWWRRRRLAVYSDRAVCFHRHHYASIGPFLRREVRAGRWARRMVAKHPRTAARVVVEPIAFSAVVLLRAVARALVLRARREDLWDLRWRLAFARGVVLGSHRDDARARRSTEA